MLGERAGWFQHNKQLKRFTLMGQKKVDAQWKLYCLVHNIENSRITGMRSSSAAVSLHYASQATQWPDQRATSKRQVELHNRN